MQNTENKNHEPKVVISVTSYRSEPHFPSAEQVSNFNHASTQKVAPWWKPKSSEFKIKLIPGQAKESSSLTMAGVLFVSLEKEMCMMMCVVFTENGRFVSAPRSL